MSIYKIVRGKSIPCRLHRPIITDFLSGMTMATDLKKVMIIVSQ
jgi:hypothetical protein